MPYDFLQALGMLHLPRMEPRFHALSSPSHHFTRLGKTKSWDSFIPLLTATQPPSSSTSPVTILFVSLGPLDPRPSPRLTFLKWNLGNASHCLNLQGSSLSLKSKVWPARPSPLLTLSRGSFQSHGFYLAEIHVRGWGSSSIRQT